MEFHYTSTSRNGDIWIFECECGYKVVYYSDLPTPLLKVENIGDINARHTSASQKSDDYPGFAALPAGTPPSGPVYYTEVTDPPEMEIIEIGHDAWLPRYLVVKIQKILGDFGPKLVKEGFILKPSTASCNNYIFSPPNPHPYCLFAH